MSKYTKTMTIVLGDQKRSRKNRTQQLIRKKRTLPERSWTNRNPTANPGRSDQSLTCGKYGWERRANNNGTGEQAQTPPFATYTRTLTHTNTQNGRYRSLNAVATSASTQERNILAQYTPHKTYTYNQISYFQLNSSSYTLHWLNNSLR